MSNKTIINIFEIEKLFKEYCVENRIAFSRQKFKKLLKFSEIDFYDWAKGNIKQFECLQYSEETQKVQYKKAYCLGKINQIKIAEHNIGFEKIYG